MKGGKGVKNTLTALIFSVCILTLIVGKVHWNQKIEATATTSEEEQINTNENTEQPKTDKTAELTRDLPDSLANLIVNAKAENQSLELLAFGSKATADGSGTWTSLLQKKLDAAYGNGFFNLQVENFGDDISINVVQQETYLPLIEQQPDIVLFEPFILNDNGKVAIENTLESVDIITNRFQESSDDIVIILQPPNPIHNAVHYPAQVQALKTFAEDNNLIYLDHWNDWPDYTTDEILAYVDDDNLPTAKGHQVWANYIASFFTSEMEP